MLSVEDTLLASRDCWKLKYSLKVLITNSRTALQKDKLKVTLKQHGFELWGSSYVLIFFNKYSKCIFLIFY